MSRKLLLLLLMVPMIMSSCVREERDDCRFPLRLRFSYLFNRENRNLLRDEVSHVNLYLYDTETGKFVDMIRVSVEDLDDDNSISWNVAPGSYSLVAWGGTLSRYEAIPGSMITEMEAGLPSSADGHQQMEEHLWHNLTTDILINGDFSPVYDIDLRKLTNNLQVNVSSSLPLHIRTKASVAASNDRYNASSAGVSRGRVEYHPLTTLLTPTSESHGFTLLRLSPDDDSHLFVSLEDGEKGGIYDGSLSQLLAKLPDTDLDLDDEFNLDFTLNDDGSGNVAVAVSINGWEIVEYNVSLNNL